jgi:hypothetical protein
MAEDQPVVRADDWFDRQEEYNPGDVTPDATLLAQRLHDEGLLFAINRLVLHPLGLALGVRGNRVADTVIVRGLVLFSTDDPEGIVFANATDVLERALTKLTAAGHDIVIERLRTLAPADQPGEE